MNGGNIIVAVLVLAALGWVVFRTVKRVRGRRGCGCGCGGAPDKEIRA